MEIPTAPPTDMAESVATEGTKDYLSFQLGKEEYAIDILQVQEIRSYETPTQLVSTSEAVKGVLNLRGVIVPIVDLRIQFGLHQRTYDSSTVVVILNTGAHVVGLVVDSVSDVASLTQAQLRPVPVLATAVDDACLKALGHLDERLLIVLDTEKLITRLGLGTKTTYQ